MRLSFTAFALASLASVSISFSEAAAGGIALFGLLDKNENLHFFGEKSRIEDEEVEQREIRPFKISSGWKSKPSPGEDREKSLCVEGLSDNDFCRSLRPWKAASRAVALSRDYWCDEKLEGDGLDCF